MIPRLAARAADGADLLVIEGMMGLFDGMGATDEASTAHVASLLDAPVVLVVDASKMSGSVAAVVHGFNGILQKKLGSRLAGVILTRVESDTHEAVLKEALRETRVLVLGAFRQSQEMNWRERRLGLVPVVEHLGDVERSVEVLADLAAKQVDLRSLEIIADRAPQLRAVPPEAARICVVFSCPNCGRRWAGVQLCVPGQSRTARSRRCKARDVRSANVIVIAAGGERALRGGGFPEEYVKEISANAALLADVYAKVTDGLVTWAECGGLLWLCRSLDDMAMCGVVAADASMTDHVTVGYRTATLRNRCPIAPAGAVLVGHEHHYSEMSPTGSALRLSGDGGSSKGGWATSTLLASYLHIHLGADPIEGGVVCARPPVACRHRQRGRGCPTPGSKEGPARSGRGDHATGTGGRGTLRAVAEEVPPRSPTVARPVGARKDQGMHEAGDPDLHSIVDEVTQPSGIRVSEASAGRTTCSNRNDEGMAAPSRVLTVSAENSWRRSRCPRTLPNLSQEDTDE